MKDFLPGEIPTMILNHLGDGSCQTIDQLHEVLTLNRRQISDGARQLVMRELLDRVETGCYRLTQAGIEAIARGDRITSGPVGPLKTPARRPRRDTLRQRAWNAMRMSVTFTIGDLAIAAARDDLNPESNIQRYLQFLRNSGYVVELPTRQRGTHLTSNGFKRFRLLKDTGPIAPMWKTHKQALWDYNLGKLIGGASCSSSN